jgi:hypothetical protein
MVDDPFQVPEPAQLPNLCTVEWAAERLKITKRQAYRYVEDGRFRRFMPLVGASEVSPPILLFTEEVKRWERSRARRAARLP